MSFEIVRGFFVHDDSNFNNFPTVQPRFGLLDESPDRWKKLVQCIADLNNGKNDGDFKPTYKVIFFGRHGQSQNDASQILAREMVREAQECLASEIPDCGELKWEPNPELTPQGEQEAHVIHEAWKSELPFGFPPLGQLYCSRLQCTQKTCEIAFSEIPNERIMVLRNHGKKYYDCTGDQHSRPMYIASTSKVTAAKASDNLMEDELWDPDSWDPMSQVVERAKQALSVIFTHTDEHFISITASERTINGFRGALGCSYCHIPNGVVYPAIVKHSMVPTGVSR